LVCQRAAASLRRGAVVEKVGAVVLRMCVAFRERYERGIGASELRLQIGAETSAVRRLLRQTVSSATGASGTVE